ncbi:DUF7261 family protein [Halocatena pleomorpha]|uniref:Uncharacterized protein n=1 Tax=Halocatena pleomorpha TaxID=1785090 RepID=A0A3P3R948_9EURY|nr:hypothetical protein [Halocatena pleomorpha]RRJ29180.1 hypothetical protein EIK79_13670 [Halocatena pleomorpha]
MKLRASSASLETERGQLVLIAAVFVAVSFIPITVAYLQLGYSADVRANSDTASEPLESTVRHVRQVVSTETNNTTAWSQRNRTVAEIHSRLRPHISTIETEHSTQMISIEYNGSAAKEWAHANCPTGSARRFGPCTADRGVIVQERLGETHLLAVVFDVMLTTDQERIEATVIIRPADRLIVRRPTGHHITDATITPPHESNPTANRTN